MINAHSLLSLHHRIITCSLYLLLAEPATCRIRYHHYCIQNHLAADALYLIISRSVITFLLYSDISGKYVTLLQFATLYCVNKTK
jgi:hypothetical protein